MNGEPTLLIPDFKRKISYLPLCIMFGLVDNLVKKVQGKDRVKGRV